MKKIFIILMSICLSGCATKMKSRLALIGGAASVGAVTGYATTLKGDSKKAHSALWASVFGIAAAVIGNYLYNDNSEIARLRQENEILKKPRLELVEEGVGFYNFIKPRDGKREKVKFKMYKTDEWIEIDENTVYHRDMKLERIKVKNEKE